MNGTPPPEGLEDDIGSSASPTVASSNSVGPPLGLEDDIRPELNAQKYGTLPEVALTGLERVASGISAGAAPKIESALADTFNAPEFGAQAQQARKETNPVTSFAGNALGFGALLAATKGFGGAGAAGAAELGLGADAAAATAAETAAKTGIEAGLGGPELASTVAAARTATLAQYTAAQRIGSTALKFGIENMINSGAEEGVKKIFNDPDQTAGSALSNIGLNGFLGGSLFGAAFGGAGELWNATFGTKLTPNIEALNHSVENTNAEPEPTVNPSTGGMFALKPDAPEIIDSLKEIGITKADQIAPGFLEADKNIGAEASTIGQTKTFTGRKIAQKFDNIYEAAQNSAKDTLAEQSPLSKYEVGKQIKSGVLEDYSKEYKEISDGYEAEKPHMDAMDLTPAAKAKAVASILEDPIVTTSPKSDLAREAASIAEEVGSIKNVSALRQKMSFIGNEIKSEQVPGGNANRANFLYNVKKALVDLQNQGILDSATEVAGKEGPKIAQAMVDNINTLNSRYAAFKTKLAKFGQESGLPGGRYLGTAKDLLDSAGRVSAESWADRFVSPGDVDTMRFLHDTQPEEFELARKYKLKEIARDSIDTTQGNNRQFSVNKFLSQVRAMESPEAQEMLFPGQARKLAAIDKVMGAFPTRYNTSNTAPALYQILTHLFSTEGIVDNLGAFGKTVFARNANNLNAAFEAAGKDKAGAVSAMKLAASTNVPANASAFKTMSDYIRASLRGDTLAGKAVNAIFRGSSAELPGIIYPSDKDKERLDKRVRDLQTNNSDLFNLPGNVNHYMPAHGIAIAKTASNAVNYLNSIRPAEQRPSPLDKLIEPTDIQKQKYDMALTIAQQPLSILKNVKDGTITSEQIGHLQGLYPALYENLRSKVNDALIGHVHKEDTLPYETKMGLSLFLGQPLDSTMTPASIQAIQRIPANAPSQQAPMDRGRIVGAHSLKNIGNLATAEMTPLQSRISAKQSPNR